MYPDVLRDELLVVAVLVAIVGLARFEMFCLDEILHADHVEVLSRQAWIVLCLFVIPVGGILYLLYGRPGSGRP